MQVLIFSVEKVMPGDDSYTQCVHYFFDQVWFEKGYTIANLVILYGLPLAVIVFCYAGISCMMIRRSKAEVGKSLSLQVVADAGESLGRSFPSSSLHCVWRASGQNGFKQQ